MSKPVADTESKETSPSDTEGPTLAERVETLCTTLATLTTQATTNRRALGPTVLKVIEVYKRGSITEKDCEAMECALYYSIRRPPESPGWELWNAVFGNLENEVPKGAMRIWSGRS